MRAQHLPGYEFERQRWANGRGWTREIARHPAEGDAFDWRVSIAEIDHDGGFSRFPGYRRSLWLLEGAGMRLRHGDDSETVLLPPQHRIDFGGDETIDCELLDGPVRAFNLIYDPQRVDAELLHRPLVGTLLFFDALASEWLIYLARGGARVVTQSPPIELASGDALRLTGADPEIHRHILDGGGELLLVRVGMSRES